MPLRNIFLCEDVLGQQCQHKPEAEVPFNFNFPFFLPLPSSQQGGNCEQIRPPRQRPWQVACQR